MTVEATARRAAPALLALVALAQGTTAPAQGRVFPGEWQRKPYVLLDDSGRPKIAVQVSCFRYEGGRSAERLAGADVTRPPSAGSPEAALFEVLRAQGVKEEVQPLVRFDWGHRTFLLLAVGRDAGRVLQQMLLERAPGGWKPATEVSFDDLFVQALSAHPWLETPERADFPAADTSAMAVWEADGGDARDPLRFFFDFDESRYQPLGQVLADSPHLRRVVELANRENPAAFAAAYSPQLYPEAQGLDPQEFLPLVLILRHPESLRLLRQIRGRDRIITFLVRADTPVAEASIEVLPFVKHGTDWYLTPLLFPGTLTSPGTHLVVNALLTLPVLRTQVRELTMATPPVVEWGAPSHAVGENAGMVELPVVLSWPSRTGVTVGVMVRGGSATEGTDFELPTRKVVFAPGEIQRVVRVEVKADSTAEGEETVQLDLSSSSPGCSVGSRAVLTLAVTDAERPSPGSTP